MTTNTYVKFSLKTYAHSKEAVAVVAAAQKGLVRAAEIDRRRPDGTFVEHLPRSDAKINILYIGTMA